MLHQLNGASERDLIKRVIALPGEEIQVEECDVYIDDVALQEPYLDPAATTPGTCGAQHRSRLVVPDDHVFVMGDNRAGRWTAATSVRSPTTTSSAGRSSCSGRRATGSGSEPAAAGSELGRDRAELGLERVDHRVDLVAEDAVETHPQRRAQLVLELQVPAERDPLEAVEQRRPARRSSRSGGG